MESIFSQILGKLLVVRFYRLKPIYTTVPAAFKIDTQFKSGQKSAQK